MKCIKIEIVNANQKRKLFRSALGNLSKSFWKALCGSCLAQSNRIEIRNLKLVQWSEVQSQTLDSQAPELLQNCSAVLEIIRFFFAAI